MCAWSLPTELVEMVLVAVGYKHQYVLVSVCRHWRNIIHSYRQRYKLPCTIRTPFGVAGVSIEMLKWAITRGLCTEYACEAAVHARKFNVLEWAVGNNYNTHDITAIAALTNQIEILEWGYKNHYDFDESVVYFTVRRGDLPMLQWLHMRNLVLEDGSVAAKYGHIHILEYLFENGLMGDIDEPIITFRGAITNGHLRVIEWCLDKGYIFDDKIMDYAAECGQILIVQFLYNKGIVSYNIFNIAVNNGNLPLLKWAHANGCKINSYISSNHLSGVAAQNGHLEILQWLRADGCPWDENVCANAAKNGHLEVLKWARANGAPWNALAE